MFGEKPAGAGQVRIKICGLTNAADAHAAIDCGADALGFNLYRQSKRHIDLGKNRDWISQLPAGVPKIAVMVNPSLKEALEVAALPFIDALQLHGKESPGFCKELAEDGVRFIKALPVTDRDGLPQASHFFTDTVLLDSFSAGEFGGSGRTFPWQIGREIVQMFPKLRVVLAGGLNPGNVAEAIREIGPFGVDVTTGVESSPGRKDLGRLRAFCAAARSSLIE